MQSETRHLALWIAAAGVVIILVVLLVLLVPGSSPGGTPTPTPTAPMTQVPTATAYPTDTSGPQPTDTSGPQPTDTSGPQPTDTSGPQPTPTPTIPQESGEVYFERASYDVGPGEEFATRVMVGFPVDFFYGAQFDLEWDHTLLRLKRESTLANGKGRLYNGSTWWDATNFGLSLNGPGAGGQGHALLLIDWDAYTVMTVGNGINASAGYICDIRWSAQGNAGSTDLLFRETRLLAGLSIAGGSYEIPSKWINSSVTVE
jgi:hypothetical protein